MSQEASIDASASRGHLLAVVHIQLQPQFQQSQLPQFAALDAREMGFRFGQQFFYIGALVKAAFNAGVLHQDFAHEFEEFAAYVFQCRHREIALGAVDHSIRDYAAGDGLEREFAAFLEFE